MQFVGNLLLVGAGSLSTSRFGPTTVQSLDEPPHSGSARELPTPEPAALQTDHGPRYRTSAGATPAPDAARRTRPAAASGREHFCGLAQGEAVAREHLFDDLGRLVPAEM